MMTALAIASASMWFGLLLLPWQPWRMRERFVAVPERDQSDLSDITVLVPARDEAATIGTTLAALAGQGRGFRVIVVDDNSSDDTAAVARRAALANLTIIDGRPLPAGWTGKLWALEQARARVTTPRVLLLDADIELAPGTVAALRDHADAHDVQLVSLMAALRMHSVAERLLMPAFIYFFKLLYPFALSNRGSRIVAAAAGGCMLLDRGVLDRIGGFAALRDAVIDDCGLAALFRGAGARTWVGVTHAARSLRGYETFASIHAMVARSAYTQLRYSSALLAICSLVMALMFWVPLAAALSAEPAARAAALAAIAAMVISYWPTLFYYRVSRLWVLLLPLTGTLYLLMTWASAWRYWRGVRTAWRGRLYQRDG